MRGGWVCIMTDGPSGTPYVGVTADLVRRVDQHRRGSGSDFGRENGLTELVLVEPYPTMLEAIAREKALKKWKRGWKLNLIGRANPDWRDLWDHISA